ncbi:MAG TPA: TetR/AcrR family transcriptional regulator [Thermoleophilaceae bacterium]|nr:TetR/AcrR family transcriptional regulator [Thermoleophilaceae bacterium]
MSSTPSVPLRQARERDLVAATRAVFDERGMQEAPIEEIARTVGIARGLVYRHFSSKEELFVLTVTDYLRELGDLLEDAVASEPRPRGQLESLTESFARYCQRYPAFLDCSLALMRRPARDLREIVSESVWLRLGGGMGRCIGAVGAVLHAGREDGSFEVSDPDYTANVLWTQGLGMMHLARIRVGLRQTTPGVPELFTVSPEAVVESCVHSALALAGAPR